MPVKLDLRTRKARLVLVLCGIWFIFALGLAFEVSETCLDNGRCFLRVSTSHEFAYVLEGSGVSEVEGQAPAGRKAGTVTYIPAKKIHESKNENATEGMKVLYFRIHPKGQAVTDSRLSPASFMK